MIGDDDMDSQHMEVPPGGGSSSNSSQGSQTSIPGPSSVVVGVPPPPLTSPVPATKIVSRNVNGTREYSDSPTS